MSQLISLENISLSFGLEPLLDRVKLQISDERERVCLIGRNGAGKSSLLKIIEGTQSPDSGQVWRKPGLRISRLQQELPQQLTDTVYEFVAGGLDKVGKLLAAYYLLTHHFAEHHDDPEAFTKLERLQSEIEVNHGWQYEQQIETILSRLSLDPDQPMSALSGGWQRRAALAKALVTAPELLLLDEPTNHLDIEAISWLEDQLVNVNVGLLFITHDRSLLQRLATRILELDRGQLTSWPGDYDNFLRRKEERLHAEEKFNQQFDKKLAQEEVWIRQGIKARRTRNEGRVRALEELRVERSRRREVEGKVTFDLNSADRSGQLVFEATQVSHSFGDKPVIKGFSLTVMRGERIGLIGPNGVGKSTLLNILLGKIQPEHGTVKQGTNLEIAYFDQLRQALDMEKTVIENVAHGSDHVEINGQLRHVMSYLKDFLFTPKRAMTPVKALSGGECNRLLLARLFSKPANLLVLDEPTNDLDIETLELLEELLSNYPGTVLLVSHDRTFLDNIATSTLVFEGNGKIQEYVGGYHDWQEQLKRNMMAPALDKKQETKIAASNKETVKKTKKLTYQEQRELDNLPVKIENWENEKDQLTQIIGDSKFYDEALIKRQAALEQFKKLEINLQLAYQRWQELENKVEK